MLMSLKPTCICDLDIYSEEETLVLTVSISEEIEWELRLEGYLLDEVLLQLFYQRQIIRMEN